MDLNLKRLAEVSMVISDAEEAVADGDFHLAAERLDTAREGLAELRAGWLAMGRAERRVVGGAARHVRARLDVTAARVPRLRALSKMSVRVGDLEHGAGPEAV